MSATADFAGRFADTLLAPSFACPAGLKTWNGSDPAKRFGVYRNNVIVSLIDALADSYPVVQALVGEPFFRAMAAEFVRLAPPRSPVLAWYGGGFADFVRGFPPAAPLPYLPDMARLEWLRVEAWHAADADALAAEPLAARMADPAQLAQTRFRLHPALRILRSAHPVVSLWAAHQEHDPAAALSRIDMERAEAALLLRPALGVEIFAIEAGAAAFIDELRIGATFERAASVADDFDLSATLALLLRGQALIGLQP